MYQVIQPTGATYAGRPKQLSPTYELCRPTGTGAIGYIDTWAELGGLFDDTTIASVDRDSAAGLVCTSVGRSLLWSPSETHDNFWSLLLSARWEDVVPRPAVQIGRHGVGPAEELRQLTGLTVDRLADLAGVSRQSYHSWLRGNPIASEREERVLRLTSLVQAASAQHGRGDTLRHWLLSPVVGTTRSPFDLLIDGDEEAFLGLSRMNVPTWYPARSLGAREEAASATKTAGFRRVARRWRASPDSYKSVRQLSRGWADDDQDAGLPPRKATEVRI